MCGRLLILSCKHWSWLMMMSLKYSVCSMSTKPGLMEIDHRGGSNVSMCLTELSWIYFSFTYLLKSNRKIYVKFVHLLSSEALLATSTIANFKTDNITIRAHRDVETGCNVNLLTYWICIKCHHLDTSATWWIYNSFFRITILMNCSSFSSLIVHALWIVHWFVQEEITFLFFVGTIVVLGSVVQTCTLGTGKLPLWLQQGEKKQTFDALKYRKL